MGIIDNVVYLVGQTWFQRPQRTRIKPMEVLCLGFSRTGTESLCNALRTLGYNGVFHGYSATGQDGDWAMWNKACMAKFRGVGTFETKDWDDLLGDYQVVSDMPCILFARELIEVRIPYPTTFLEGDPLTISRPIPTPRSSCPPDHSTHGTTASHP